MKRQTWTNRNVWFGMIAILATVFIYTQTAFSAEEECMYCGMKRSNYGHSWVVIEHGDGTVEGLCSVHCAAIDMALHTHKTVSKITVGDYNTKKQINVDKAFWVIGGDRMGVMTARAKWAFETKEAADAFITNHGGRPATFDEIMKAAFEDMYEDTLMIQKKRQMKKNN